MYSDKESFYYDIEEFKKDLNAVKDIDKPKKVKNYIDDSTTKGKFINPFVICNLTQEELVKKHLFFDVVDLKMIQPNRYGFFINSTALAPYKTVYCRFERPGFVMKEGYQSPIFELKLQ